jgi:3-phenylpropionate/trans-cinnamate dioxygenase ferredoxin reductase component
MSPAPVVVVGAGQAGVQVADSLRSGGHDGPVVLIGDEPDPPYQRPPLSKDFLTGSAPLPLRGERFFSDRGIDHRAGVVVTAIDRARRTVALDSGDDVAYSHLVLATGAAPRALRVDGSDLSGVLPLRTLGDARAVRAALSSARRVAVVGAGFIGLEFAAAARKRAVDVTVFEAGDRVLGRAVSSETGRHLHQAHRDMGSELRVGEAPVGFEGAGGVLRAVVGPDGRSRPADVALVGIGVLPRTALAHEAGLVVDDGIVVDEYLRTSDPVIFAIGDCARFPAGPGGPLHRLESVQNATDQARHVALTILGAGSGPYVELPWFWSIQGEVRLQIAGVATLDDDAVVGGDPADGRFSVFRFRADRLVAVESVNRPADHAAARRVLAGADRPTLTQVADPVFRLKEYAIRACGAG